MGEDTEGPRGLLVTQPSRIGKLHFHFSLFQKVSVGAGEMAGGGGVKGAGYQA